MQLSYATHLSWLTRLFPQRKILLITIIEKKNFERVPTNSKVRKKGVGLLDVYNLTAPRKLVVLFGNQFNWMKPDFLLTLRHQAFLGKNVGLSVHY